MNFHLSKFGSWYTPILCIFCRNTLQLQISEVQKFFYIKILYFCELRKKSLAVGSQITKLLYLQNKEVYLEHSLQGECFCATSLPLLQSPSLRLRLFCRLEPTNRYHSNCIALWLSWPSMMLGHLAGEAACHVAPLLRCGFVASR